MPPPPFYVLLYEDPVTKQATMLRVRSPTRIRRSRSLPPSWPRAISETGSVTRRLSRRLKYAPVQSKNFSSRSSILHKHYYGFHKSGDRLRKIAKKFGQRVYTHRYPLLYAAATGLAAVGIAWITRNVLAYSAQTDSIREQYTAQYPFFLHTKNAYTVLGLPEPWYESWVPPREVFRAAVRRVNIWHPDRSWRRNGCSSSEEAQAIWNVYKEAIGRFEDYYELPFCQLKQSGTHNDANLLAAISDGVMPNNISLPRYDKFPTECTLWSAISAAIQAAFTSPANLPAMPSTDEERRSYYPCSLKKVVGDVVANSKMIPPLRVPRFWSTPSLKNAEFTKNPINWLVHYIGKDTSWRPGPTEWNQTEVMAGQLGKWLTPFDFDETLPICEAVMTAHWDDPGNPDELGEVADVERMQWINIDHLM